MARKKLIPKRVLVISDLGADIAFANALGCYTLKASFSGPSPTALTAEMAKLNLFNVADFREFLHNEDMLRPIPRY